jgi:hypothetical protein
MGPTALLPLRRKLCCGFLSPLKIRHTQLGLNPRILGPMASILPLNHRGWPISNYCRAMMVSRYAQGRINNHINQMSLLLHFMRYILQLLTISATVFNAQLCLFQARVYCLLNHFRVFLYVSSIHNLVQEFLLCVLWSHRSSLSSDPLNWNKGGLVCWSWWPS